MAVRRLAGIIALVTLAALCLDAPAHARRHRVEPGAEAPAATLLRDWHGGWLEERELPPEGRELMKRIHRGGPFEYDRDGVVFGNREHSLPVRRRGYYHEYTVRTPGVRTRGARRIVCGGAPAAPDLCFYTDDHYRSFRAIRETPP
jgi:ribonuclease T1